MSFIGDLLGFGRREHSERVEPDLQGEMSALDYGPSDPLSSPSGWLVRQIGPKTKAGVQVNEQIALTLPVVYACVNRIANPISRFPLKMYRAMPDGTRRVVSGDEHPFAARLGLRPNDHMSSRTVRKTAQAHALLAGNGYLEIERNGRGQAIGLYPLLPNVTRPVKENGRLFFSTLR